MEDVDAAEKLLASSAYLICEACNGSGWRQSPAHESEVSEPCPECQNSGKVPNPEHDAVRSQLELPPVPAMRGIMYTPIREEVGPVIVNMKAFMVLNSGKGGE